MPLRQQLQSATRKMMTDFDDRTTALEHRLDRGEAREAVVRGFLEEWLPTKYSYGRGEIISQDGQHSNQTDVVVFDALNSPAIFRQPDAPSVYPVESVYGFIEVKSRLDKQTIHESVSKNARTKSLPRQQQEVNLGALTSTFTYAPLSGIFAFQSPMTDDALLDAWTRANSAYAQEQRTQIACILGRGCLMWRPRESQGYRVDARDEQLPLLVKNSGEELLLFYLALHMWFGQAPALQVPNLLGYAGGELTYDARWAQEFPFEDG